MVVEIAGLPGSGKSTLVRLLRKRHPEIRFPEPVLRRDLVRHPVAGMGAAGRYTAGRIAGLSSSASADLVRSIAAVQIRDDGRTVLEEGPVHLIWRELFLDQALAPKNWQFSVRQTHPLIVLQVDRQERIRRVGGKPGVAAARRRRGGRPRLINRQLDRDPDQWVRGEELFEAVLSAASPGRVVRFVDTSGTIEESVAALEAALVDCGVSLGKRRARSKAGPRRVRHAYQEKVKDSLDERADLYLRHFPAQARTVLDVGCNLGAYTRRYADAGYVTLGIDNAADLVKSAAETHLGSANCGFMVMEISPDSIDSLPEFDVTLLLSVQHHWLMAHGPDVAGQMLATMVRKTRGVVIFETASRRERYEPYPPDFIDNDEESVTRYIESYLKQHVGHLVSRIEPLGKMPCVAGREPYRWNYALHR
jgi:SAM-dependent methyltransferase